MLEVIDLWIDPEIRDGPENMAVDELLWANCAQPLLRTYRWSDSWLSIGYFSKYAVLREQFPYWGGGVVRRPTGGGIVDHSSDWTYSLFLPRGNVLAEIPAAESYRFIHVAISQALQLQNIASTLCSETQSDTSELCFRRPVEHDLIDQQGKKIAGAGQRRGGGSLLHQGSIARFLDDSFARNFARCLAVKVKCHRPAIDPGLLAQLISSKYGDETWTTRK